MDVKRHRLLRKKTKMSSKNTFYGLGGNQQGQTTIHYKATGP